VVKNQKTRRQQNMTINKAIVLGATGGMGKALTSELLSRGIATVAFSRSQAKLEELRRKHDNHPLLTIIAGDAFHPEDIEHASAEADVLFQSIGLPYPEWSESLIPLTLSILEGASRAKTRVVQIDNIYPYGRSQMEKVSEDHPRNPHSRKGKLRLQMEQLLLQAHERGIPVLIARFPDFYGPDAPNSMLDYTLQAVAAGKVAGFVGSRSIPREFIYLPDGAKAAVELASRDDAYGQNWNIPGPGVITGKEIIRLAAEAAGRAKPRSFTIGRGMLTMMGLFSPFMREVIEMLYLTEKPVVLSGAKFEQFMGIPVPATPYEDAIPQTVKAIIKKQKQLV
jgi:nucleoside-diphosphate-sugar epimerase